MVRVVTRAKTSIFLSRSTFQRSEPLLMGTNSTYPSDLPKTAAATARQRSASNPIWSPEALVTAKPA